jgi:hypothetical protein
MLCDCSQERRAQADRLTWQLNQRKKRKGRVLPHSEAASVSTNLSVGIRADHMCNQFLKNAVGWTLKENENAKQRTKELLCYTQPKQLRVTNWIALMGK